MGFGKTTVAIMQPYFLPYIGYYQLIKAVDVFVVYDNIRYTKKGWINRNRFLQNGKSAVFTLPLRKGHDGQQVRDRYLADDFDRGGLVRRIEQAYWYAPFREDVIMLFKKVVFNDETNLFRFLYGALIESCAQLGIETEIVVSSQLDIDHGLKAQDKVLAICRCLGADVYINPSGGKDLYTMDAFLHEGISLKFMEAPTCIYRQYDDEFVPYLSILDVMMFNPANKLREYITSYAYM